MTLLCDDLDHVAGTAAAYAVARHTSGLLTCEQQDTTARAAVTAGAPYLRDGLRIVEALRAARHRAAGLAPVPSDLWQQARGDLDQYLQLMRRYGHLTLETI